MTTLSHMEKINQIKKVKCKSQMGFKTILSHPIQWKIVWINKGFAYFSRIKANGTFGQLTCSHSDVLQCHMFYFI